MCSKEKEMYPVFFQNHGCQTSQHKSSLKSSLSYHPNLCCGLCAFASNGINRCFYTISEICTCGTLQQAIARTEDLKPILMSKLFVWSPHWLPVPFYGEHFVSSGLCYDSSTKDYKAIFAPQSVEVIVASFKTKQCIKICFPHNTVLNSGPLVKERLHWLASRSRNNGPNPPKAHQIFYFDPLKDEFFEFPSPLPLNGEHNNILGLGVLDRCLCLVRYLDPEGLGRERDVLLVMKEYGVGESWTSLFTTPCIPRGPATFKGLEMVPFCFRKNGEVLVALNGEKILVYDPDEELKRYIQIPNIGCDGQVIVYEESMVSPVAYRDEEGSTEGERRWKTDTD